MNSRYTLATMSYAESISANVKAEARRRNIQNQVIADHLGFSKASLAKRFNGTMEFRPSEIEKIAQLFDVPISVLTAPVPLGEKVAS